MASQIAQVGEYTAGGDSGPEVKGTLGGDIEGGEPDGGAMDHYGPSGDDSPPLVGDWALCVAEDGRSEELVVAAYSDETTRTAKPGEVRRYARNASSGEIVGEIHLKGDGEIRIAQANGPNIVIAPSGEITLSNGPATVTVATDGSIKLSGSSVSLDQGAALGQFLQVLHTNMTTWAPVPNDGGAALKAALIPWLALSPPSP